jgi:streptogramin lyase
MRAACLAAVLTVLPQLAPAQAHHVTEQEPNDSTRLAKRIALGDSVSGEIATHTDVDFFAIDIAAGATLRIFRTAGNVRYMFYDTDGVTRLSGMEPDYVADHPDKSVFAYPITVSGTYFIRASAASPEAEVWITGQYALVLRGEPLPLGPGDPLKSVADIPELSTGAGVRIVGGPHGEIFVAFAQQEAILRIGPSGERSSIVTGLRFSGGFAVDAFGDLLISGAEPNDTMNRIWRVRPSTETKEIVTGPLGPFRGYPGKYDGFHIAVAPEGDFWAGDVGTLRHFDPVGRELRTVSLPRGASWIMSLAVSPTGVVHYAYAPMGIYRVNSDGSVALVVADSSGELAFDREGNLYLGQWSVWTQSWEHVMQFDSTYRFVRQIAHVPYLDGLTFARDANGELTPRLLTIQGGFIHDVVMLAPAASLSPGSGVRIRLSHAELAPVRTGTLGNPYTDTLRVTAVTGSLSWSVATGMLPPGITLSAQGVLAGIPTDFGTFAFAVEATDGTHTWYASATLAVKSVPLSVAQIAAALIGGPPLSPALVEFLDAHGNKNGRLDVGDLRSYARSQGMLTNPQ